MELSHLNQSQRQAVEHLDGPLVILAGAGSGKTRVLTHRLALLIESGRALPGEIMALTFTNKAAKEMLHRVENLLGGILGESSQSFMRQLWVSTFHSSGAKILRQLTSPELAQSISLKPGFTILDDSDQLTAVKESMRRVELSDKVVAPKSIQWKINQLKNEAMSPSDFTADRSNFLERKMAPVLHEYQKIIEHNNCLDFGDLLLKPYQLFKKNPAFCASFQDRYRYLLVDEYQDTNGVQYNLLKLLSSKHRNLCVVGDEDQSIYKWRGADISNILNFEKDFPEAAVIKLEENYRSTSSIISAANKVIANNTQRKEKNLFTNNEAGDPVEVHFVDRDLDESRWVAKSIKKAVDQGTAYDEIAILYRTNAQSRLLEDSLRYERIPYKIYGGLRFYDRAEIKDALAYLRVLVNPRDDVALFRIVNRPTRGIGKQSIERVKEHAADENLTGLEAMGELVSRPDLGLGSGPRKKLNAFLKIYSQLNEELRQLQLSEFYGFLLEKTGYLDKLKSEDSLEALSKIENLEELASAISEFEERNDEATLEAFLEEVALISELDRETEENRFVTMMTVHSAKGLEFLSVYLVGMEDGLFPSIRGGSMVSEDPDEIEEERRLCYVGMTRAQKKLLLTGAKMRRVFGSTQLRRVSRFVGELPQSEIRFFDTSSFKEKPWNQKTDGFDEFFDSAPQEEFSSPKESGFDSFGEIPDFPADTFDEDPFAKGAKVRHPKYGVGTILSREGAGERVKLSVKFGDRSVKKFMARFAALEVVS